MSRSDCDSISKLLGQLSTENKTNKKCGSPFPRFATRVGRRRAFLLFVFSNLLFTSAWCQQVSIFEKWMHGIETNSLICSDSNLYITVHQLPTWYMSVRYLRNVWIWECGPKDPRLCESPWSLFVWLGSQERESTSLNRLVLSALRQGIRTGGSKNITNLILASGLSGCILYEVFLSKEVMTWTCCDPFDFGKRSEISLYIFDLIWCLMISLFWYLYTFGVLLKSSTWRCPGWWASRFRTWDRLVGSEGEKLSLEQKGGVVVSIHAFQDISWYFMITYMIFHDHSFCWCTFRPFKHCASKPFKVSASFRLSHQGDFWTRAHIALGIASVQS